MTTTKRTNQPTLDMAVSELAELPSAVLYGLQTELDTAKIELQHCQAKLFSALEARYSAEAQQKLRASGKSSGVIHILDGEHDVQFRAKTEDEWNQATLSSLWDQIASAGEDPRIYMRRELSVQRTVLKGWPEEFQKPFLAALTTTPQKPSYRIVPVKGGGK